MTGRANRGIPLGASLILLWASSSCGRWRAEPAVVSAPVAVIHFDTVTLSRVDTITIHRVDTIAVYRDDPRAFIHLDTMSAERPALASWAFRLGQRPSWGVQTVFYSTDRSPQIPLPTGTFETSVRLFRDVPAAPIALRYGSVSVSIPASHRPGETESPRLYRRLTRQTDDPSRFIQVVGHSALTLDSLKATLRREVTAADSGCDNKPPCGDILLYVHGYNNSFNDAAVRTAQLAWDLGWTGPAVFYSWSSSADVLNYLADRNAAERTVPRLARFLIDLQAAAGSRRIHVIAHSTGAQALGQALQAEPLARTGIHQIVLAAPDIDAAVFREQILPALSAQNRTVTLYASSRDRALALARRISGGQRAGETRPEPVLDRRLVTIDASSVDMDLLGHAVVFQNQALIGDLFNLLVHRRPPNQRLLRRSARHESLWVIP